MRYKQTYIREQLELMMMVLGYDDLNRVRAWSIENMTNILMKEYNGQEEEK